MTDIASAIKQINNDAEFICHNEDINNIEWLNGTTPISKTDIENKITQLKQDEEQAKQNSENSKTSAITKLKDLGLTDDEIKAIKEVV